MAHPARVLGDTLNVYFKCLQLLSNKLGGFVFERRCTWDSRETMVSITLSPASQCIYCGVSKGKLTTEHVIPHSMGGRIKLPSASCESCQRLINSEIEEPYVRCVVAMHRKRVGVKSRSKTYRTSFPVNFLYENGQEEEVYVAEEDLPFSHSILMFEAPPFCSLRQKSNSKMTIKILAGRRQEWGKVFAKYRPEAKNASLSHTAQQDKFLRLIKKIAIGLFFDADPRSAIHSGLGKEVLCQPRESEGRDGKATFQGYF